MYKLRKTYCSVLLHSGYNEELVQGQLRHEDARTLREHYKYDVFRQNTKSKKLASSGVLSLVNAHLNETAKTPQSDTLTPVNPLLVKDKKASNP